MKGITIAMRRPQTFGVPMYRRFGSAVAVVLFCLAGHAQQQQTDPALKAAMVPDATLVFQGNVAAIRKASIHVKWEEFMQKRKAAAEAMRPQAAEMNARLEVLQEILALNEDDVKSVLLSANLEEGLPMDENGDLQWDECQAVAAITLAKPLSMAQITEAVRSLADDQNPVALQVSTFRDFPMLAVSREPDPDAGENAPNPAAVVRPSKSPRFRARPRASRLSRFQKCGHPFDLC